MATENSQRSGEHYHIHAAAIFRDLPDHAKIDPMRHAEDPHWQISKPPAKWPLSHFRDHWEPIRTDYNDTWGRLGHHWPLDYTAWKLKKAKTHKATSTPADTAAYIGKYVTKQTQLGKEHQWRLKTVNKAGMTLLQQSLRNDQWWPSLPHVSL